MHNCLVILGNCLNLVGATDIRTAEVWTGAHGAIPFLIIYRRGNHWMRRRKIQDVFPDAAQRLNRIQSSERQATYQTVPRPSSKPESRPQTISPAEARDTMPIACDVQ